MTLVVDAEINELTTLLDGRGLPSGHPSRVTTRATQSATHRRTTDRYAKLCLKKRESHASCDSNVTAR